MDTANRSLFHLLKFIRMNRYFNSKRNCILRFNFILFEPEIECSVLPEFPYLYPD